MHHLPAGRPLSARVAAVVRRTMLRPDVLRPGWARIRRLGLSFGVTVVVTGLVLAVPVVSGAGHAATPVTLDSSSTSAPSPDSADPVVIMGVDGLGSPSSGRASREAARTAASGASAEGTTAAPDTSEPPAPSGSSSSAGSADPAATTPRSTPGTPSSSSSSPPPTSERPVEVPDDLAAQVLALVDEARTDAGCGPLAADPSLGLLAHEHSADMRDDGFFDVVDPDGEALSARGATAATIAQGPADAASVVAGWLADAEDRAALLDCTLTRTGVGLADGTGGPWWTLTLA